MMTWVWLLATKKVLVYRGIAESLVENESPGIKKENSAEGSICEDRIVDAKYLPTSAHKTKPGITAANYRHILLTHKKIQKSLF